MRKVVWVLAVAAAVGFAPAPFPKPPKTDATKGAMKDWMGEWLQIDSPTVTLEITPTSLTYHNAGGTPNAYALVFDAMKTPRTYNISRQAGGFLGIYRVEGDLLTICYNSAQQGRPIAFEGPGKGLFTERFKRKKP